MNKGHSFSPDPFHSALTHMNAICKTGILRGKIYKKTDTSDASDSVF